MEGDILARFRYVLSATKEVLLLVVLLGPRPYLKICNFVTSLLIVLCQVLSHAA